MNDNYATEEDTAELMRVSKLPKPLRLAAMLEKTMQWPLHGKSADCLREMYVLFQHCENEMRYAGWDKREADNYVRNDVYVDRWRLGKRGQFEKVWVAVHVPEDCPHPKDRLKWGAFYKKPKTQWVITEGARA